MRSNVKPRQSTARLGQRFAFGLSLLFLFACPVVLAQTITSSGLNTAVSGPISLPNGQTQVDITGGTRPGGGGNVFHSFGSFNVPSNTTANFLNNSGLPTSNILGRVTGGNISNILGTIQTTGFGNANLFLMNPAGFLFGPNATLNVGGMVAFTSADYLRLADGGRFNAIANAGSADILTAAPVAAFGFLGSNPGAISLQGSQLTVAEGTGIALVGGDITGQGTTLKAPSGQINLVALKQVSNPTVPGEVLVNGSGQGSSFTPTGFAALGTISFSQGSTIDVTGVQGSGSEQAPGKVVIRGGQFIMNASSILANAYSDAFGPPPGTIEVTVDHAVLEHSIIRASAGTAHHGGNIMFNVDTLSATDSFILSNGVSRGDGSGGTVDVKAVTRIDLANTEVNAGTRTAQGGTITMASPVISMTGSAVNVSGGGLDGGPGGTINLAATQAVNLINTRLDAGSGNESRLVLAGAILINGGELFTAQQSVISAQATLGGRILVQACNITLTDSQFTTSTGGANPYTTAGQITLGGHNITLTNGQILSGAYGGSGGTIDITTPVLRRNANSVIDASSTLGADGTVTINGVLQP
jgi:filamentous hemagglutinin family protein